MNNQFPFVILCRAVRPTTNSWVTIQVPDMYDTPEKAAIWVGKELNYNFIPMQFDVVTPEVAEMELRLS